MLIALLLDLANIAGGFLLAIALLSRLPRVGDDLARGAEKIAPFGWIVGVTALVCGGYYLLVHLVSGPHVFHFEIVGILVGLALLRDRLTGRTRPAAATGTGLLLAVFGIIAIVVGLQGLFTPDN
ncbi:hypothetical protein [Actinoplanes sp. N902-109]|uniref:hypothetical protein n=1 Tax=Actinoplanes sp. (strain N902-109) TaxID=649831 RepID=UPI00032942CC|nr:hypothetical protein [Actinoplanes sp. N902-109]AGL17144.1 hypothetical protein L083_3634 [Actinoplanes sp. N902-109]